MLEKEAFIASWLWMDGWAFVDIKLQTKGGWTMQGCVMQGHRNMAGGSHTIPWNGASPLWSWRLLVHKSQAILLASCSRLPLGALLRSEEQRLGDKQDSKRYGNT